MSEDDGSDVGTSDRVLVADSGSLGPITANDVDGGQSDRNEVFMWAAPNGDMSGSFKQHDVP